MVLVCVGIGLALLAVLAFLPIDRLPPWLNVYVGVAAACGLIVVAVALIA